MTPSIPHALRSLATLCCLLVALGTQARAQTIVYGESVSIGNGTAQTWVEVDADDVPLRIGMTLTEGALTGLPSAARVMSLDLPEVAADSLFKHVMFDWAPSGHPPSVYAGHPHFDFHFFMLSEEERLQIPAGTDETPIPPEYMPEDYIPVPGLGTYSFPRMGVHYVDSDAPELNGEPFTRTLIYGFFDGEMIFVEPMITVAHFESHPTEVLPIKQPEAYQKTGYYPTAYQIEYDAEAGAFDIFLTDLVLREGTTTSSAHAPPARQVRMKQIHPNPFHAATTLSYELDRPTHLTLEIYDVLGRRIRTLVDASQAAGSHEVVWDGRDAAGEALASGTYVARLRVGNVVQSHHLTLIR